MRKPVKIFCRIFILLLTTLIVSCAHLTPQKNSNQYFESWPSGTSPQEIGKRVAERFVVTPHGGWGRTTPVKSIPYLKERIVKRFEPLFTPAESSLIPPADHVDHSVFGAVPFEIYIQTKDQRCLDLGKSIADKQWENPTAAGLTPQTRFWIDDMFMITALPIPKKTP